MTQPQQPVEAEGVPPEALAAAITAFTVIYLAEFGAWLESARQAVISGVRQFSMVNPGLIRALEEDWTRRVDNMMPLLMRAARRGWEDTASQLGLRIPFDPTDPILTEQLARTRNLLVNVDNEVYRMVISAIADGTDEGENVAQIARRVDNVLSSTGTTNWANRASVVGRTEVTRFTEAGALSATQRFQERTGRRMVKRWINKDAPGVREVHRAVDGDTVPIGALFDVGSSYLRYPGDPSGMPHDVINCRCHLRFGEM